MTALDPAAELLAALVAMREDADALFEEVARNRADDDALLMQVARDGADALVEMMRQSSSIPPLAGG
jgi:hypothetical protein